MKISDALSRTARTALQLGVTAAVVEWVDTAVHDMSDRTYTASILLGTVVLTLVQTVTEQQSGKALLRKVPAPAQPVVDTGPPA